jgi:hypothetical protein
MSSKKAEMPNDFDFSVSVDLLQEIVNRLPNPQECQTSTRLQAKEILQIWRQAGLVATNRFAKAAESKRLDEIEQLAKKLRTAWHKLDPELQVQMRRKLGNGRFTGAKGWTTDSQRAMFTFLQFGPDVLKEPLDAARSTIQAGKQAGRSKWPAIRVVEACSFIWADRTGQTSPTESATEFTSFVQDVFYTLKIDPSVAHTIRAWREQKWG